jgi:putative membrane protein insertion efficiency factor
VSVIAGVASSRGASTLPARGAIGLIRFYQRAVSPFLPRVCRFHPSCSAYAVEAIECHGLTRGLALAAWRLARCQPFARGGFDPVPPPRAGRGERGR